MNEVLIKKVKEGYRVTDKSIEAKDSEGIVLKRCKTMRGAIKFADKYRDKNTVDCGVRIRDF